MSRKTRARVRPVRRQSRWVFAVPAAIVLAAAGWWLFVRDGSTTEAGRDIASYRPPDIHALAVHPDDPNVVIFGSHRGMLISRDAGRTWAPIGPSGDAMGIALPPGSRTAFAAGHDVLFRSDDGGRTWSMARTTLPGTDIHGFTASAVQPGRFYAFVVGHGLFRSDDAGTTWVRSGTAPGSTMSMSAVSISAVAGGGQETLIASTMEGVQRSRDGAATWERVPELGGSSVSATAARAYAAAGQRILASSDAGATWQSLPFPQGRAALVAPAPSDPNVVYVLAEGLSFWRSSDGGRTWERMS